MWFPFGGLQILVDEVRVHDSRTHNGAADIVGQTLPRMIEVPEPIVQLGFKSRQDLIASDMSFVE
jgi:hypothetical protein